MKKTAKFEIFSDEIFEKPQLFGPILVDLALIIFLVVFSNLAARVASDAGTFHTNFTAIPLAIGYVLGFALLTPILAIILFFLFSHRLSFFHCLGIFAIYSFSNLFFIFSTVFCLFPQNIFRWAAMVFFTACSVVFLMRNYAVFLEKAEAESQKTILFSLVGVQVLALLSYKVMFF